MITSELIAAYNGVTSTNYTASATMSQSESENAHLHHSWKEVS